VKRGVTDGGPFIITFVVLIKSSVQISFSKGVICFNFQKKNSSNTSAGL
jgi:hypothetical protein